MKKIFLLNMLAVLITACVSRDSIFSTIKGESGLIAYVGADGNMYTSDQGGGHVSQLTKDASLQPNAAVLYQMPTWSPDGNQLAYIRTSKAKGSPASTIVVTDTSGKAVNDIYTSESQHPFYMLWSPDAAHVSFLSTSSSQGLLLLQSAAVKDAESTILDTGSPYYWSWAPDGKTLITHSGGANTSTTPEHFAFIQVQDSGVIEDGLDTTPGSFQAPAWSPDGGHIALTQKKNGKNEIILVNGRGAYEQTVSSIGEYAAFGWSADSKKLAYIDGKITPLNVGIIGKMSILNVDTSKKIATDAVNVFAYFWSPNGEQLVYFVPVSGGNSNSNTSSTQQLLLQTFLLDAETGVSTELFTYRPTSDFVSILPYFDQYQQSNTIWSPDSKSFVLSFVDQNDKPAIAIVNISNAQQPTTTLLAEGTLAFWSWK